MDMGNATPYTIQVLDTDSMATQGITHNDDGSYTQTAYSETAKLMKTETIEVGKAENIRLDDAPEYGTLEVKDSSGEWNEMEVGKEYKADSEVRFTPDESAVEGTQDIKIGTFGEHEGQKSFTGHADVSDWGEVSADGKSVVSTEGGLTVTTTVMQNGSEQTLKAYNGSGNSTGAGIGDKDSGGLSRGETMVIQMQGEDVNQVSFTIDGLGGYFDAKSSHATEIQITAFDKDGNEIDSQGGYRESGKYADDYSFTTNIPVDHFELTSSGSNGNYVVQNMTLSNTLIDDVTFTAIAEDGTELTLQSDINIQQGMESTNVTSLVPAADEAMTKDVKVVDTDAMAAKGATLVDGYWVVENGTQEVEPPMKDEVAGYEYEVTLNSGLVDIDGSESLSNITIDNLPEGTSIVGLDANRDGSYTIATNGEGNAMITLSSSSVLTNTALNNIESSVSSTEENGGETHTTMAHTNLDESADSDNDTVEVNDNNLEVDTAAGDDTISVDASDLEQGSDSSSNGFMGMNFFGRGSDGGDLDIDGGDGFDSLLVSGDVNIDMSALDDNISNIETLTLDTGSQNITNLSLEDVISVTDENNVLRIDGDSTDTISLDTEEGEAEWTLGDFKTDAETGATYQEVTGVEDDVTVTLEISTEIHVDQN